jgi:glycosyltransferase involved in cell wall biosynthesis
MGKIVIISFCWDDWGGSEELWARSIPSLLESGHELTVLKDRINYAHPEFIKLADKGVKLTELNPAPSLLKKITAKGVRLIKKIAAKITSADYYLPDYSSFKAILKIEKPTLVVFSQGINFDGLKHAHQCLLLNIPYVIISQKAVDFFWPQQTDRQYMLETLQMARKCYFVSHHNLELTEEQFGKRLQNSQVIFNPVKLSGGLLPFPSAEKGFKLACPARLFILDKGQDILIRILAMQKWKDRQVHVSFIGTGSDEEGLKAMARLLNVTNIEFTGQLQDIETVWLNNHALILPSRSEGLPLSMVEAMSAGRPVIVTNAGGNAELVQEGVTGFIGEANTNSFDQAMERAWTNRDQWESIGINAAKYISKTIPKSPENDFATLINEIINDL